MEVYLTIFSVMEEEHHEARVSKLENFALRFERVTKFEEVTFPDCRDPITLRKGHFPFYAKPEL